MEETLIMTTEQKQTFCQEVASAVVMALQQSQQNAVPQATNAITMTRDEVCQYLGIGFTTLWVWQKAQKIIPIKIGRKRYYRVADVQKLISGESQR